MAMENNLKVDREGGISRRQRQIINPAQTDINNPRKAHRPARPRRRIRGSESKTNKLIQAYGGAQTLADTELMAIMNKGQMVAYFNIQPFEQTIIAWFKSG